ncbi:SDR family NAD(P)-dependent oxidoreductase [Kutzneria sp. NPDC052558]|uniref:SDR family NAD(P)-dependent oxidoreductase n=1 Tax=Kutzneria sp. NPDC052558 TaxID=3364121 RepID=UPI0037CAFC72
MDTVRQGGLGTYDLAGKVAVVAGGSGAIGGATARRLAAAGATVVVGCRKEDDRIRKLVADLPGHGHWAAPLPVDDTEAIDHAASLVGQRHGAVHVLVNAAGTTRRIDHDDLDALDDDLFDEILRVNVRGVYSTIRAFRPLLVSGGDSVVVNVSSLSSETGKGSSIAYCASKAALDTMGKSLARVLAPEVRVIGVSPAAVDTGFVPGRSREAVLAQATRSPLRTVVDADDVAVSIMGVITQLRLTTGSVVLVDGGWHL